MATYQILSWHGIPTGVKAIDEDGERRINLPRRFQAAVDAVATKTGNIGTKPYLAGYQWSNSLYKKGTAVEVAQDVAANLERKYTAEEVKNLRRELERRLAQTNNS